MVILHLPVVVMQVRLQYEKLRFNVTKGQADEHHDGGTHYDGQTMHTSSQYDLDAQSTSQRKISNKGTFCTNWEILFNFKPQSQEYLYKQLFGDDADLSQSIN